MVAVASLFSQLLQQFPRHQFQALVQTHQAEKHAKGFSCWTQFIAMLFSQLAHADSLREICNGLKCCEGKLTHLGVSKAPNRSTLAYANANRPCALFQSVFYSTYDHFQGQGGLGKRKARFRFKNKLLSLDATVISLCLALFPWARFRRAKGGVKVHTLLDHDTYMPVFVHITEARRHEVQIARSLSLNPDSIVAMDMAYINFAMLADWNRKGVFFVSRLKKNAVFEVVQSNPVPKNRNIISDDSIRMTGVNTAKKYPDLLRRIIVWDETNQRTITLLTNHHEFGATTIAAIYKDRWEIELFFKALKQNLKIKTFVGTSENALHIQIWTALIALLILKWLHHISKAGWSLSNLASMLRLNLFTYRDLTAWLAKPFHTDPLIPLPQQLALLQPGLGQPRHSQTASALRMGG